MTGLHLDDAFAARGAEASRTFTKSEANLLVSALGLLRARCEGSHLNTSDLECQINNIINNGWEIQS